MAVLQLPLMVETLGRGSGGPSLGHLGPSELPRLWSQHRVMLKDIERVNQYFLGVSRF